MNYTAAFDCDGTLIRGDATRRFLLELRGPIGVTADLLRSAPQLLAWQLGLCSTAAVKQVVLDRALQATPIDQRRHVLQRLSPILVGQLRSEALARLHWHQQQGHRCLIVTASPEPLITPLARHLGVELIATGCTDLLAVGPGVPFRLRTPNCKGVEKVRRLEQYLGTLPPPDEFEAYGDSRADRELLRASGRPHWRSFTSSPVAYPREGRVSWLLPVLSVVLLLLGLRALALLPLTDRQALLRSLSSLLHWIPVLYALLALSYFGRYARWRLLLGSVKIGRWGMADALGWFRGFALTASPGKLGELSRIQDLHHHLSYPRTPLLHAFLAERFCDGGAVLIWLAVVLPDTLPIDWRCLVAILLGGAAVMFWLWKRRQGQWMRHWRDRLPRGTMARACVPALLLSLGFWAVEGLVLWLLIIAVARAPIAPMTAIGIYLLSGTAGIMSTIPGGIGINEAATVLLLQQQGVELSAALPIAVLRRVFTIWSVMAVALLCTVAMPPPSRQSV